MAKYSQQSTFPTQTMSSLSPVDGRDEASEDVWENATTLMFRHIPRKFTGEELTDQLNSYVDPTAYDYVYVPWDRRATHNMGFAFVNFVWNRDARRVGQLMQGIHWKNDPRGRTMTVYPARMQGLYENLSWYSKMNVADPNFKHCPWVFEQGVRVNLLSAIERLCGKAPHLIESEGSSSTHYTSSVESPFGRSLSNGKMQQVQAATNGSDRMSSFDSCPPGLKKNVDNLPSGNFVSRTNSNASNQNQNIYTNYGDSCYSNNQYSAFPAQRPHGSNMWQTPPAALDTGAPKRHPSAEFQPATRDSLDGGKPFFQPGSSRPMAAAPVSTSADLILQHFSTAQGSPVSPTIDSSSCMTVSPQSLPKSSLQLLRHQLQQQHHFQQHQSQHSSPIEIEVPTKPLPAGWSTQPSQDMCGAAMPVTDERLGWPVDQMRKGTHVSQNEVPGLLLQQCSPYQAACSPGSPALVGATRSDDTCSNASSLEFPDMATWQAAPFLGSGNGRGEHSSSFPFPGQGIANTSREVMTTSFCDCAIQEYGEVVSTSHSSSNSYNKAWSEVNSLLLKLKERGMLTGNA